MAKTIPGLMVLRYKSLSMSLLLAEISSNGWLSSWWSSVEGSRGVLFYFDARSQDDSGKSKQYFLWEMHIPDLEWATFNPRKIFENTKVLDFETFV